MVSSRIVLKRAYEQPSDSDGLRVLVDRLLPRGLTKAKARIDLWLRDLAPSNELRKWFHAHPEHWKEFRQEYLAELHAPIAQKALEQLYEALDRESAITLLFEELRPEQCHRPERICRRNEKAAQGHRRSESTGAEEETSVGGRLVRFAPAHLSG